MQLNPECVRDVLLAIESADIHQRITLDWLAGKINYDNDELWYTCIKLSEAGFLEVNTTRQIRSPLPVISIIRGLTYQGHEFLNEIRDDTSWGKIKEIGKKVSIFSIKQLADIAKTVACEVITSALQQI